MGLCGKLGIEWSYYIIGLQNGSIFLDEGSDSLKWSFNKYSGEIRTKLTYQLLAEDIICIHQWWNQLWSWKAPYRIIIFYWLALENRLLSWDNFLKRGMLGPNLCVMCGLDKESIFHLFVSCIFSRLFWKNVVHILKCSFCWLGIPI